MASALIVAHHRRYLLRGSLSLSIKVLCLLFVLAGPPDRLFASLGPCKILLGLTLSFTLLPSHIDEFFLVSQHVFPIQVADINELYVLIPALKDSCSDSNSMAIKEWSQAHSECFLTILASYRYSNINDVNSYLFPFTTYSLT